jgi:hypothetical protein
MPAIGANDGSGMIVRIEGTLGATPVAADGVAAAATPVIDSSGCAPIPETLFAPPVEGSPEAPHAPASPAAG